MELRLSCGPDVHKACSHPAGRELKDCADWLIWGRRGLQIRECGFDSRPDLHTIGQRGLLSWDASRRFHATDQRNVRGS